MSRSWGPSIAIAWRLVRWRLHEAGDEGDAGVDLVGDGAGELFRVDEVVGGQAGSPVARGLDGAGGEELGRFGPEDQQASHGGTIHAVFVPEGHPRIPQQAEPGGWSAIARRTLRAGCGSGRHGCGEYGLLVKDVLAAPLLEEPDKLRGREGRAWWNRSACSNAHPMVRCT